MSWLKMGVCKLLAYTHATIRYQNINFGALIGIFWLKSIFSWVWRKWRYNFLQRYADWSFLWIFHMWKLKMWRLCMRSGFLSLKISKSTVDQDHDVLHRPASLAFICTPPLTFCLGVWGNFAKIWVSLQTTTYKSEITKYFVVLLLLSYEPALHAPTVQIWAQNSAILPPNNLLISAILPLPICHRTLFQKWW